MKRIVLFILLSSFYTIYCEAQTDIPFYEQTALDFYNSEILPRSNIDIKLKISDDLKSIHYIDAECLKNEKINEKNISSFRNSKASQG